MPTSTPRVFLLIGQSNMAGRGVSDEVAAIDNPDILMFRVGRWVTAREPLHTDKPDRTGIGIGMSFAQEILAAEPGASVGLVPCAVGGTPLGRWMPGGDLSEAAVSTAREALADGDLGGFLWHQGEADSREESVAASYGQRLTAAIGGLREQLGASDTPFIAGELGEFLSEREPAVHFATVNSALAQLGAEVPLYGCASAAGLPDKGDSVHFDSPSLREFGRRYAAEYLGVRTQSTLGISSTATVG